MGLLLLLLPFSSKERRAPSVARDDGPSIPSPLYHPAHPSQGMGSCRCLLLPVLLLALLLLGVHKLRPAST